MFNLSFRKHKIIAVRAVLPILTAAAGFILTCSSCTRQKASVFCEEIPAGIVREMNVPSNGSSSAVWYVSENGYDEKQAAKDAMSLWLEDTFPYAVTRGGKVMRYDGGAAFRFALTDGDLADLKREEAFLEEWTGMNMPMIVPDGTDAVTALRIVYKWIASHTEYDREQPYASVLLSSGKGNCRAVSGLFMAMVRSLSFSPVSWVVDRSSAAKLEVQTLTDPMHSWNAVRIGGEWRYFDISFDLGAGEPHYFNLSEDAFYTGRTYKGLWGEDYVRSKVLPAER